MSLLVALAGMTTDKTYKETETVLGITLTVSKRTTKGAPEKNPSL